MRTYQGTAKNINQSAYFALALQASSCLLSNAYCCVGLRAQVIEFESTALMIGQLGVRVSLIAYPVVSIKKARGSLHGHQICSHRHLVGYTNQKLHESEVQH